MRPRRDDVFSFGCSTHSQIETNQPCSKSLKKLLRSGARKGNGTSIEDGKSNARSSTKVQKVYSVGKMQDRKAVFGSTQEQENKKRRRKKHKGKKRERKERERSKERNTRKEKHERRKGTVKQCVNMFWISLENSGHSLNNFRLFLVQFRTIKNKLIWNLLYTRNSSMMKLILR